MSTQPNFLAILGLDGSPASDRMLEAERLAALNRRDFYRCTDCLSVGATDAPRANWRALAALCACGGSLEHMGKVSREVLTRPELYCPCDARCTSARGPICQCSCGGENHGSGALFLIDRVVGPVPPIKLCDAAARLRAEQYRAERERVRALLPLHRGNYGDLPPRVAYWAADAFAKADKARTHSARMRKFAELEKRIESRAR